MDTFKNLALLKEDGAVVLTIAREEALNALTKETLAELSAALDQIAADDSVRGVIITGRGGKAFIAGADIKELQHLSPEEAHRLATFGHREVMDKLADFSKPVIAAINGFALGGGLELALACHIRIVATHAKMGLPEVSLGIIPGYGGTQRLTQLVGRGKALEMIMTGEMIDAQDALKWGLANHVVEQAVLIQHSKDILSKIFSKSRVAISNAIQAVNAGVLDAEKGFQNEIKLFAESFGTAESQEGITAFIEKRKPNF